MESTKSRKQVSDEAVGSGKKTNSMLLSSYSSSFEKIAVFLLVVLAGRTTCSQSLEGDVFDRTLQQCSLIPVANFEAAWEWAANTDPRATGMIAYQNGMKRFEQYELANVCPFLPFLCRFRIMQFILLEILNLFPFGGSATRPMSMYSITKSLAGLAAVLLDRQDFIQSLDETVATYIEGKRLTVSAFPPTQLVNVTFP